MKKRLSQGKLPTNLLKQLLRTLPTSNPSLIIPPGIGLDAAGLKIGNQLVAVTTDPITFTTDKIALYSVVVNINDVACLGCCPCWYLGVLLLPIGTDESSVKKIWQELSFELKKYGITSIGGHVEVTPTVNQPVLIGQIIGKAVTKKLFDARNSSASDKILLCKKIAIEGTAIIAKERANDLKKFFSKTQIKKMQNLLHNPGICIWPYVEKILKIPGIIAMHDPTEGGIATALHELADASRLGINIDGDKIPILDETKTLAKILKFNPLGLLASGSLLIVCKASAVKKIIDKLGKDEVTLIGELTKEKLKTISYNGKKKSMPRYDHDEIVRALAKSSIIS